MLSALCFLRIAAAVCAVACAAPSAQAAPDFSSDVKQLLVDKGLIDRDMVDRTTAAASVAGTSLGQQVRNKTSEMVSSAMNFLGVPYRRGGDSVETGFDCSGFTRHIFESSIGMLLPRRADEQAKASGLVNVKKDDLKPGDLVFFNTLRRTFSHVGIYVGDGKFIHAPRAGSEIRIEDMGIKYWAKRFTGARRAPESEMATSPTLSSLLPLALESQPGDVAAPVSPAHMLAPLQAGTDALARSAIGVAPSFVGPLQPESLGLR